MESKRKHNTKGKGVERIDKQYPDIMIENDQDEELIQQIMDEFDQKDSNESNKQSSTKENASSKQQNSNKGKDLTPSKAKDKNQNLNTNKDSLEELMHMVSSNISKESSAPVGIARQ